jgi:hypothetical protein
VLGPHSDLHAAWDVLSAHGIGVVPSIVAWSAPRQPLDPEALDEVIGHVLARCDDELAGAYIMPPAQLGSRPLSSGRGARMELRAAYGF